MRNELPQNFKPSSLTRQPDRFCLRPEKAILDADEGLAENVQITVEDGIIHSVEVNASVDQKPERDLECIDIDGVLIPGLIDAHCHVAIPGYLGVDEKRTSGSVNSALVAGYNLQLALKSGLTSVRDCGIPAGFGKEVAAAARSGLIDGPRVIHSGPGLTGGESNIRFEVCDESDAARAVRNLVKEDVDFIKVYASGGGRVNYQPAPGVVEKGPRTWESHLTAELMQKIVEEASAWGLMVTAHATDPKTVSRCIEAGLDGIEHAEFLTGERDHDIDDEIIARLAASNIFVCPTLTASWRLFKYFEKREDELSGFEKDRLKYLQNLSQQSLIGFEKMVSAGVTIAAGSDAGTMLNPMDDYASELELMGLNGMTNEQVLASTTKVAAEAIGLGDQTGRIEPGYLADFTVLDSNPLSDLTAYERVTGVFVQGRQLL